ncbi:hypothetical protein CDD83_2479 [Cordyceps sp. RAO-2017]|nr:hypothetical protein CDD83_2479 [Cordyceps sp. RAO-2017]
MKDTNEFVSFRDGKCCLFSDTVADQRRGGLFCSQDRPGEQRPNVERGGLEGGGHYFTCNKTEVDEANIKCPTAAKGGSKPEGGDGGNPGDSNRDLHGDGSPGAEGDSNRDLHGDDGPEDENSCTDDSRIQPEATKEQIS